MPKHPSKIVAATPVVDSNEVDLACAAARSAVFKWSRVAEAAINGFVYPGAERLEVNHPGTAPRIQAPQWIGYIRRACDNEVENLVLALIYTVVRRAYGPRSCMDDLLGWQRLNFQAWTAMQALPAFQELTRDLIAWGIWAAAPTCTDPDAPGLAA